MCANFKPLTRLQAEQLGLPAIPFDYVEEVYPNYTMPLLFQGKTSLEWRQVNFGLIPKWAENTTIGTKTYNARHETLLQKPTFAEAAIKCKFGLIPVTEFYESKYVDGKPQRWAVRRRDGNAFYIAALYEICKIGDDIVRSATMLSMDAIDHPMMKEFHEPGNVKRSIIVIPHDRMNAWLNIQNFAQMMTFVEGFPVEEFECLHHPKPKMIKETPQLSFF
jgi:putative SOS response-associated peptidase YedK